MCTQELSGGLCKILLYSLTRYTHVIATGFVVDIEGKKNKLLTLKKHPVINVEINAWLGAHVLIPCTVGMQFLLQSTRQKQPGLYHRYVLVTMR